MAMKKEVIQTRNRKISNKRGMLKSMADEEGVEVISDNDWIKSYNYKGDHDDFSIDSNEENQDNPADELDEIVINGRDPLLEPDNYEVDSVIEDEDEDDNYAMAVCEVGLINDEDDDDTTPATLM